MEGFSIIAAVDERMGIGRGNALPWRFRSDMEYFKEITGKQYVPGAVNVVIMGRRTWESLPEKFRPLPGRINAVVTSVLGHSFPKGVHLFSSFDAAVAFFLRSSDKAWGEVFVIGGAAVYAQAIKHPFCKKIYLTHIEGDYSCDVFFPAIPESFSCVETRGFIEKEGTRLAFRMYQKA